MHDDTEEAQTALADAQRKMRALRNLTWRAGAGASVWARAAADQLERHEATRDHLPEPFGREHLERLHGTAFLVVVAVDQVLKIEARVRRLTGVDAQLARARDDFRKGAGSDAANIRDLVIHFDAYAVGEGHRQLGKRQPPISHPSLETFLRWSPGGTVIRLADDELNLRDATRSAVALAEVIEQVVERHLEHTAAQLNEASRRRWGFPNEAAEDDDAASGTPP